MPRLVDGGWQKANGMSLACGSVVYKTSKAMWVSNEFLHMGVCEAVAGVDKPTPFTQTFTQQGASFRTVIQQQIYKITSVFYQFLHIIHTPYKNNYRLYKGVY